MKPALYCQQIVTAKEPGFGFAIKTLSVPTQNAVTALMAFYIEMDEVIFSCQEPVVALAKLNWWRLEVTKWLQGQAVDHPVIVALREARELAPFAAERLLPLIDGMAQNVNLVPFSTFEEVTLHVLHTAGIRELLMAEVVRGDETVPTEVVYQLALVLELARFVQHLHRYVRRGVAVFGDDELRRFQVSQAMLQRCRTTLEIKNLLAYQVEKAERAFLQATAGMTALQRRSLANLLVRASMALALLREIEKSDFKVLEQLISLTPIRCWWIAFRSRAEEG